MAKLQVQPRHTRTERAGDHVVVDVDEPVAANVTVIEDWVTPRSSWELTLHEGDDAGRANNAEGRLLYVDGEQTSSVQFRLDQLDVAEARQDELMLRFDTDGSTAKVVRCEANGFDVELFHILTYT